MTIQCKAHAINLNLLLTCKMFNKVYQAWLKCFRRMSNHFRDRVVLVFGIVHFDNWGVALIFLGEIYDKSSSSVPSWPWLSTSMKYCLGSHFLERCSCLLWHTMWTSFKLSLVNRRAWKYSMFSFRFRLGFFSLARMRCASIRAGTIDLDLSILESDNYGLFIR